jgi:NADH-quinone oxidoreductase subunit D
VIGTSPVERTAAAEGMGPEQELMTINMGPHHPATHGVLRLLVSLEGEVVRDLKPIVGYVHTGIEKNCEDKSYWKVIPFVERMDYLSSSSTWRRSSAAWSVCWSWRSRSGPSTCG